MGHASNAAAFEACLSVTLFSRARASRRSLLSLALRLTAEGVARVLGDGSADAHVAPLFFALLRRGARQLGREGRQRQRRLRGVVCFSDEQGFFFWLSEIQHHSAVSASLFSPFKPAGSHDPGGFVAKRAGIVDYSSASLARAEPPGSGNDCVVFVVVKASFTEASSRGVSPRSTPGLDLFFFAALFFFAEEDPRPPRLCRLLHGSKHPRSN